MYHSTVTMTLNFFKEASEALGKNMAIVVKFLDLIAKFDTIDTSKLLKILEEKS